ncbi:hypothetical protein CO666_28805, partial [Rhizobium chutanense]
GTVRHVSEHLSGMYPGFTSRPGMTESEVGVRAKLDLAYGGHLLLGPSPEEGNEGGWGGVCAKLAVSAMIA